MAGELQWDALASAVKERRLAMRFTQDLSEHGGPGHVTVRKIENGEATSLRAKTKTQLEHALAWQTGMVDEILNGTADEASRDVHVIRANQRFIRDTLGPLPEEFEQTRHDDPAVWAANLAETAQISLEAAHAAIADGHEPGRQRRQADRAARALAATAVGFAGANPADAVATPTRAEKRLEKIYHLAHEMLGELMTSDPTPARARLQDALLDVLGELRGDTPPPS